MTIEKAILDHIWAKFDNLEQLENSVLQDGRFSVTIDDGRFECLLFRKKQPRLFVLLSGARDPERQHLPKFDRWSWYRKFPGSVICISDPTLYLAPDHLKIGWYVGTSAKDWTASLADLLRIVSKKLKIPLEKVVSYGSSAGGFASLMLACRLGPATGVAINPQILVLNYSRRFVDSFLEIAFEKKTPEQLSDEEKYRLSVCHAFKKSIETKFVIAQNTLDRVHYFRHFGKFCETFGIDPKKERSVKDRVTTILFSSPVGHGAEPKEMVNDLIKEALNDEKTTTTTTKLELKNLDFSDIQKNNVIDIKAEQLYLQNSEELPSLSSEDIIFSPHGRIDIEPITMSLPFDWNTNPYKDSNWCAQLQKWNMLDKYILAYESTQNSSYLQIINKVIIDWYRHHIEMEIESLLVWRDFVVGMRAMKIAYLVSKWLQGKLYLKDEEAQKYQNLIKLHFDFILNFENIKFTNHTFFDFHGGMALSKVIDLTNRKLVERFLFDLSPKLIASQFDKYGVHLEHSFAYQGFGIRCLERLSKTGWFDILNIKNLIKLAEDVQKWFIMPDGRIAPIGDTNGQASNKNQKKLFFNGTRQVFNTSGYCIIRSAGNGEIVNSSYFCMMGAFHNKIHKHPDDLSIIWYEGEDILCDPGKFAYKSHKGRKYAQSTRAHNTIEIDETDYSVENEDAYGSAINDVSVKDWGYLVSASVNHKKFGVRHTRFCLYQTGHFLFIIDRLISKKLHKYVQWNHFSPHLKIMTKNSKYFANLNKRLLSVCYSTSGESTAQLVVGETTPRMQGWISQEYGKLSPSRTLGIQQSGKDVIFATLLCIDDERSKLLVNPDGKILLDLQIKNASESFEIIVGTKNCRILTKK